MAGRNDPARSTVWVDSIRVRFGGFELDEANARLLRGDTPVAVAPTPFAVLCALARDPGSLLTKQKLLDLVWGHQFVSDSVLKTAISDLRTILDDDPRQPRFIETVSRKGYRFIAATSPIAEVATTRRNAQLTIAADAPSFVGREEALARLNRTWDLVGNGKRSIVWVAGEPGIGKTTLIDHFVAELGDIACARGQCVEHHGTGEPYLPVLEALAELCRLDADLPDLLRAVAPTWLVQLPWLSTPEERASLRRELAGASPEQMLRQFGELLDRYAEQRPFLLVTEDLHWSDRATIQLIDFVARRRGSARAMWLATFRLAEVVTLDHPLNALRHELRLHRLVDEIVLDPFSETEVAAYVAQQDPALGKDEAFVRALHERTDGVPLFVSSVLTDILTRRPEPRHARAGAQLAMVAVPENLAAIIDHYIAQLATEERSLLAAAAVCGAQFRLSTLALVIARDAADVSDLCEDLARKELWLTRVRSEQDGVAMDVSHAFRHALFRQQLYERTTPLARVELHRKVGLALEQERGAGVPVTADAIATHFERARDALTAMRYHADAAESALAHFSPAECMSISEHALTLLDKAPEGGERDALEITLATLHGVSATHVLGMSRVTRDSFARAYSLIDRVPRHPMSTRLLHGFGFVLGLRAEYTDALSVADRAEALAHEIDDPLLVVTACMIHGEADQVQGRSRAARVWIERGLAALERADHPSAEMFASDPQTTLLGLLAIQLLHADVEDQARAALRRAHARAHGIEQPMARLVAIWFSALLELRLRNAPVVAALADEMRALVEEYGVAQGATAWRWFRGWADAHSGNAREGYRAIREAYEENVRLGMLTGMGEVLGYATEALLLAGDFEAAQRQLDEALRFCAAHGERVYLPQLLLTAAAILRGRGDQQAAEKSIRRALDEARSQEVPWLERAALVELCSSAGASADDRQALAELATPRTPAAAL